MEASKSKVPTKKTTKKVSEKKSKPETVKKTTKKVSPKKVEKIENESIQEPVVVEVEKEKEAEQVVVKQKKELTPEKLEKRENRIKEIRAFFILLLLIGAIGGGTWYWYNYCYDSERNKKNEKENVEETVEDIVSFDIVTNQTIYNYKLFGKKYVVEADKKYIYKVFDLNNNILFEGKEEYSNLYIGNDGNLYYYTIDYADVESIVELYRLKDKEFKKVETLMTSGIYYSPMFTGKDFDILVGFVGNYDIELDAIDQDEELNNYIYLVDGSTYELGTYLPISEMYTDDFYAISNDKYVLIVDLEKQNNSVGIYDLENEKVLLEPKYDSIIPKENDEFIVCKNNKYGIIDSKLEEKIEIKYDLINVDGDYYSFVLDNVITIKDSEYRTIESFDIADTSFEDIKDIDKLTVYLRGTYNINDNIVLVTSIDNAYSLIEKNLPDLKIFIINEDSEIEVLEANEFVYNKDLIYSYNHIKKQFTIYNNDMSVNYDISLSKYSYKSVPKVSVFDKKYLFVNVGTGLYISRDNGDIVTNVNEYVYEDNKFKVSYNKNSKELIVEMDDKKEELTAKNFIKDVNLIKKDDGNYVILYDDMFTTIVPAKAENDK